MLLFFLLVGILVGFLRRGGLSGLARMNIKAPYLLALSFLVELSFSLLDPALFQRLPQMAALLQLARFLPLLIFCSINCRNWRIALMGAGVLMNFAVILANNGRMPVGAEAINMPELAEQVQRVISGKVPEYFLMTAPQSVPLWFLGDILIFNVGVIGFASMGDVVLGLGVMLAVQHGMARSSGGKHVRGNHTLHTPPEPRMLAGDDGNTINECQEEPAPVLSPRLSALASMVPQGASVADVGCDHGKLAVHLALNGAARVVACDISSKSLAKAQQLVKELALQQTVSTRVGNGLQRIKPGEVDTIILAGMGGPTICDILDHGDKVVNGAARLVLQPMNAIGTVRRWIVNNGFYVAEETIAEDDGRLYQILCALPGAQGPAPQTLFDLEIGPVLVRNRHPLLGKLLCQRIELVDKILDELKGKDTPKAQSRRLELQMLRQKCAEVERWLAQSQI